VAITSPFFALLLRGRDLSLPVVPSLLPYSSSPEVRVVGVTGCIRTASPIPSRWRAGQCRGALVGDVGALGWSSFSEALPRKCSIGQRLVRCGVGLRTIEDAGW
jgi:hypothetical protein